MADIGEAERERSLPAFLMSWIADAAELQAGQERDCNANGVIDDCEAAFCAADFAEPFGELTIHDYLAFHTGFGREEACTDLDGNGLWNVFDFLAFQSAFGEGC